MTSPRCGWDSWRCCRRTSKQWITIWNSSLLRSTCATTHNLIQACLKRHLSHQLRIPGQFLIQQLLAQQINLFSILSRNRCDCTFSNLVDLGMVCRVPAWLFIAWAVLAVAVADVSPALNQARKLLNHRNRCCWSHALCFYWWFDFPDLSSDNTSSKQRLIKVDKTVMTLTKDDRFKSDSKNLTQRWQYWCQRHWQNATNLTGMNLEVQEVEAGKDHR